MDHDSSSITERGHGRRPVAITGANSGVGFEAARLAAGWGHPVVLVCRSRERGEAAMDRIRDETPGAELALELCDLGELDQVRDLAHRLRGRAAGWAALVNNAGLYKPDLVTTSDGLETTVAVNHMGHYLLTRLLEPELRQGGARIVNVASQGHFRARLDRRPLEEIFRGPSDYNGVQAYCDSKLCNVLFTRELVRRWGDDVTANALHPGVLATEIWEEGTVMMFLIRTFVKPFMDSPAVGGKAAARLALGREFADVTDRYFKKEEQAPASPAARDEALARRVWELSAELVGLPAD